MTYHAEKQAMLGLEDDVFEVFIGTGIVDRDGLQMGHTVAFVDDGVTFYAAVTPARCDKQGDFFNHGPGELPMAFTSQEDANRWAYGRARERNSMLADALAWAVS